MLYIRPRRGIRRQLCGKLFLKIYGVMRLKTNWKKQMLYSGGVRPPTGTISAGNMCIKLNIAQCNANIHKKADGKQVMYLGAAEIRRYTPIHRLTTGNSSGGTNVPPPGFSFARSVAPCGRSFPRKTSPTFWLARLASQNVSYRNVRRKLH